MSTPEGACAAMRWPSADARQKACKEFCDHLAKGHSIESFPAADRKTIRYYAEQFPEDFPPEQLEAAARRGLLLWEQLGLEGVRGDLPKFNASAWNLTMKNRAGWRDRSELESSGLLGVSEDGGKLEAFKPRSSREIGLGVMALLTEGDVSKHVGGTGNTD